MAAPQPRMGQIGQKVPAPVSAQMATSSTFTMVKVAAWA